MKCTLDVNEVPVDVDVEPWELIVGMLRDRLGLTGTKVACDTAQCGSCIVPNICRAHRAQGPW